MADLDFDEQVQEAIRRSLAEAEAPVSNRGKESSKASEKDVIVIEDSDEEAVTTSVLRPKSKTAADPKSRSVSIQKSKPTPEASTEPAKEKIDPFEALKRKAQRVDNYSRDYLSTSSSPGLSKETDKQTSEPAKQPSIFGLDRAQMERERLERAKKRKLEVPDNGHRAKSPRMQSASSSRATVAARANIHTMSNGSADNYRVAQPAQPSERPLVKIKYPNGVVKKTYICGRARKPDDITIEEVLQKEHLHLAVMSSFMWDDQWIVSKFDPLTYRYFVRQAKTEEDKTFVINEYAENNIGRTRFVFPSMAGGVNCMHSKLQLLFYHNTYMRIVVPTANLTSFDWGVTGSMENSMFIIDLPYLEEYDDNTCTPFVETGFSESLFQFCKKLPLEERVLKKLHTVDFSATKNLAFVHSMGGTHQTHVTNTTGLPGLSSAIRKLGLAQAKEDCELDYVPSSLGSLKKDFLSAVYFSAMGLPTSEVIERVRVKPKKGKNATAEKKDYWKEIGQRFRIYFPSKDTVAKSNGGPDHGGTICFQRKWFQMETFPKEILYDCVSTREGMLMHNKCLFFRFPRSVTVESTGQSYDGWAYIGSHNLSESAWGNPNIDQITGQPKVYLRNWECGVVIPLKAGKTLSGTGNSNGPVPLSAFEGTVPVPMRTPAPELRRPWFFQEN